MKHISSVGVSNHTEIDVFTSIGIIFKHIEYKFTYEIEYFALLFIVKTSVFYKKRKGLINTYLLKDRSFQQIIKCVSIAKKLMLYDFNFFHGIYKNGFL